MAQQRRALTALAETWSSVSPASTLGSRQLPVATAPADLMMSSGFQWHLDICNSTPLHTRAHTRTHAHEHTHVHTRTSIQQTSPHTCAQTHMQAHTRAHMHV